MKNRMPLARGLDYSEGSQGSRHPDARLLNQGRARGQAKGPGFTSP